MMKDYRPDLAFVVTGAVWQDFLRVREETGDALCLGFLRTCEANIKEAEDAGDNERARHWQAVQNLAYHYGISFISAVEVDGRIIRECEKFSLWDYPDDAELTRMVIDADAVYVAPPFDATLKMNAGQTE